VSGVGDGAVGGGGEGAVELPGLAEVVGGGPDTRAEPGEERRAEGCGLDELRPLHLDADLVGLDLAEQVVGGGAAVDAQRRTLVGHRLEHIADLERDRLQGGADEVRPRRAAGDADDQAARVRVPVRGAEAGQRGHEHDSFRGVHGCGDRRGLGGRADDLQPVAQPLHGGAGHEDRALERIGELTGRRPPGRGRQQPGVRSLQRAAGVGQDERAGAVRALGVARVEAGLPEQRRLLVTGHPGDRQRQVEERRGIGRRDLAPVGHQLGQRVARHAEQPAQLVRPVACAEVEQQGPARVGDIGDVVGAAGHPRHEVGVDRPDGVPARLDQRPRVRLVLGQPHQLGAGEVRVQPEPGELGDPLLVALVPEPGADVGSTAVLPDDRAPRRAERLAVPEQDRLPLVGDPDRLELAGVDLGQGLAGRLEGGLPDLLRGVLDPARLGEVLPELLVAPGRDGTVPGDDDRGDAGGAGVDREDAHASESSAAAGVDRTMSRIFWSIQDRSGATRIS
jgi:hypothetical protein